MQAGGRGAAAAQTDARARAAQTGELRRRLAAAELAREAASAAKAEAEAEARAAQAREVLLWPPSRTPAAATCLRPHLELHIPTD